MRKNLLLKSGVSLLMLTAIGMVPVSAAAFEGSMYTDLQALHASQDLTSGAARGAEGPIRSLAAQPTAKEIYFTEQRFDLSSGGRGVEGRIASDADMATERNREEWKTMVGIFVGSD